MGFVHKLKPEIVEFIIQQKKANPSLSCRGLAGLLFAAFKIKVSKSSVNEIIKGMGLSQPVGRRMLKTPQTLKEVVHLALSPDTGEKNLSEEAEKKADKEVEERARREEEEKVHMEQERLRLEAEKIAEDQKALQEQKKLEDKTKALEEARKIEEDKRLGQEQERIAKAAAQKPRPQEEPMKAQEEEAKAQKENKEKETVKAPQEKERDCSGLILLKAVDYLLGGSFKFNEIIQKQLGEGEKENAAFTEGLIYSSFLEKTPAGFDSLKGVLGLDLPEDKFRDYFLRVQKAQALKPEFSNAITDICKEVRCLQIIFADGSFLYFDADFYTTWSTEYTPYDFSTGINKVKRDLDNYFLGSHPLIIFMAPGYDLPTKEFMGLVLNFSNEKNAPQSITLYDNKLAEISAIRVVSKKSKYQLVFGLWPWQFVGARSVKSIGEFASYHLKRLDNDFLLADIQLELIHPESKQKVMLFGCALKTSSSEQTRLVILTTAHKDTFKLDELADMYLCNWPNQEETFQDYSRKVELFIYTAHLQKFFSLDLMNKELDNASDIGGVFTSYFKLLDLYLKWHFLPIGYEEKDFQTMKSRFYDLGVHVCPKANSTKVAFKVPAGYAYTKDLEYLCRRLNEKNIEFYPGETVKFSL